MKDLETFGPNIDIGDLKSRGKLCYLMHLYISTGINVDSCIRYHKKYKENVQK